MNERIHGLIPVLPWTTNEWNNLNAWERKRREERTNKIRKTHSNDWTNWVNNKNARPKNNFKLITEQIARDERMSFCHSQRKGSTQWRGSEYFCKTLSVFWVVYIYISVTLGYDWLFTYNFIFFAESLKVSRCVPCELISIYLPFFW